MHLKSIGLSFLVLMALGPSGFGRNEPAPAFVGASTAAVIVSTSPREAVWRQVTNTAFSPGEELRYVVKWGVIVAGHSNLSVLESTPIAGRPIYHIVSTARSGGMVHAFYKVKDRNETWVDQGAFVTYRYEKQIREGKYRIDETSILDQVNGRWKTRSFRLDKNRYEEKEGDLPPNTLDAFGSLYYVRTLPLEEGLSFTIDVFSSDKVWPLIVNVRRRETIKVAAGKFKCFRVEPLLREPGIFISKGKKLEVWITDDKHRIPVLMRSEVMIGHVAAELVDYKLGGLASP